VSADSPALRLTDVSDRNKLFDEQKADTTLDPYWHMELENKGDMFIDDGVLYLKEQ